MRTCWLALALIGCGGSGDGGETGTTGDPLTEDGGTGGGAPTSGGGGGTSGGTDAPTTCDGIWAEAAIVYPDVGTLADCDGDAAAAADSFMDLSGLVIDNAGESLVPCVDVQCDAGWVYVASNALPHYDFIATTPNPLVENRMLFRFPRDPGVITSAGGDADDAGALDVDSACADAYADLVDGLSYSSREPSGMCIFTDADADYLTERLADGTDATWHKIQCLDIMAVSVNGVPVFGPNEGPTPDPWGNPAYSVGNEASEWGQASMLDLCFGHTADAMHYHGLNEECLLTDADGAPALSYAEATASFDLRDALDGGCVGESPIVGWSLDGYPIQGPCVCAEREADGSCATVKRVRSAWVYRGMKAWGADAGESAALGSEGDACDTDADCDGDQFCRWTPVADASAAGSSIDKICVQADYSWCSSAFVDRSDADVSGEDFVYLDRCNGYDGPDGYRYHATASFPFVPACYRGEPSDSAGRGGYVDASEGGPGGGGPGGGP